MSNAPAAPLCKDDQAIVACFRVRADAEIMVQSLLSGGGVPAANVSMVAGNVPGAAGTSAFVEGLIASGITHAQARQCRNCLAAGGFLVVVHGSPHYTVGARQILENSEQPSYP